MAGGSKAAACNVASYQRFKQSVHGLIGDPADLKSWPRAVGR
ncbi:hypothetical protein [Pseudomonas sp. FEN]|nr:hypothetical protein [Pseudomonas sp. FEN]